MTMTTGKRKLLKAGNRIVDGRSAQEARHNSEEMYMRTMEAARQPASQDVVIINKNTLRYKGYVGSVAFSAEDRLLHGRVRGIKDVVTFEGTSVDELDQDFREAVDHYLEHCEKTGKTPEKPFSGKFVLRIPSDLHCAIAVEARQANTSINEWITRVCACALGLQQPQ